MLSANTLLVPIICGALPAAGQGKMKMKASLLFLGDYRLVGLIHEV